VKNLSYEREHLNVIKTSIYPILMPTCGKADIVSIIVNFYGVEFATLLPIPEAVVIKRSIIDMLNDDFDKRLIQHVRSSFEL
jgi:hypothetical protein